MGSTYQQSPRFGTVFDGPYMNGRVETDRRRNRFEVPTAYLGMSPGLHLGSPPAFHRAAGNWGGYVCWTSKGVAYGQLVECIRPIRAPRPSSSSLDGNRLGGTQAESITGHKALCLIRPSDLQSGTLQLRTGPATDASMDRETNVLHSGALREPIVRTRFTLG